MTGMHEVLMTTEQIISACAESAESMLLDDRECGLFAAAATALRHALERERLANDRADEWGRLANSECDDKHART